MTDFALPNRFDLVSCMIDSIAHVVTLDALVAHLGWVRRHLAQGGRYVIEGSHPAEYFSTDKRVLELDAAARLAGLVVPARFGDFHDLPVTDERAWRMITVLRPM